jgi:hypothetical protein
MVRAIGADRPGMGSPCSVPSPLLEAARARELVLVLGWRAIAGWGLPEEPPQELRELIKLQLGAGGAEAVRLLGLLRDRGLVRRIVYLGDDGVLARSLGGFVLDLYGSRGRMRCSRCGRRWWMRSVEDRRCPHCGGEGVEDYVPLGGRPHHRLLAEAIYEVTSAQAVVAGGLELDTITLSLTVLAAKLSKLYTLRGTRPPDYMRQSASTLDCTMQQLATTLLGEL